MPGKTPKYLIEEARTIVRSLPRNAMPYRELEILKRRASGASFREIGAELDITTERVAQLHAEARKRARSLIRNTPAEVYVFERFGS